MIPTSPPPSLCIVIGASTGGPATIVELLQQISHIQTACIILLQHLEAHLSTHLSAWLADQTGHTIIHPQSRHTLQQGEVILLTGSHWIMLDATHIEPFPQASEALYATPSIDMFFHSTLLHWKKPAIGVLLTGMGKDGAEGLFAMKKHGWKTYTQDESSCYLYGMPKEAARIGAASFTQSPIQIGNSLQHNIQYHELSQRSCLHVAT